MKEKVMMKMIENANGNNHDINHFMKVYTYACTIAELEGLDERKKEIVEIAAIVHDIACPLCRTKYGNTNGHYQEIESEALLRPFLKEFALEEEDRIVYLVCHHHTVTGIDDLDYQILIEADYLVNADESHYTREAITIFRDTYFKTSTGKQLLNSIFLR